ncbi:MAG: FAD-dependent oxidoreductase [Candidatus Cyclobacteriaceae bacterium M3_2C_046]
MHQSLWKSKALPKNYSKLQQHIEADVCIVGGGITGLTTAYQLKDKGMKVVVLEALHLGAGTTGHSSNHLNTQVDFSYQQIFNKHGEEKAKTVASSRQAAIDWIETVHQQHAFDCDWKRVDGYLYAEKSSNISAIEQEFEYAQKAGLAVSLTDSMPLPFPVHKALVFPAQAQFNSQKYLMGLASVIENDCQIFENSRVVHFDHKKKQLYTAEGSVTAKHIVLATHIPLFINIHQTTAAPYRSYMITAQLENYPPDGLYWDNMDPYHYTRLYQQDQQKWLVLGGADHKTGHDPDIDYYQKLETYLNERYQVKQIDYRWSSQYYEPADGLPYIGESPGGKTLMATGYSGDGLVYGTIAGLILSDSITGNPNPWQKTYDSKRIPPLSAAPSYLKENLDVAKRFVMDRFKSEDLSRIQPQSGALVEVKGNKYAIYRDKQGKLHTNSAICPHLGCLVDWNHMEHTWDCPCHGSRFTSYGEIMIGPATRNLEQPDVKPEE